MVLGLAVCKSFVELPARDGSSVVPVLLSTLTWVPALFLVPALRRDDVRLLRATAVVLVASATVSLALWLLLPLPAQMRAQFWFHTVAGIPGIILIGVEFPVAGALVVVGHTLAAEVVSARAMRAVSWQHVVVQMTTSVCFNLVYAGAAAVVVRARAASLSALRAAQQRHAVMDEWRGEREQVRSRAQLTHDGVLAVLSLAAAGVPSPLLRGDARDAIDTLSAWQASSATMRRTVARAGGQEASVGLGLRAGVALVLGAVSILLALVEGPLHHDDVLGRVLGLLVAVAVIAFGLVPRHRVAPAGAVLLVLCLGSVVHTGLTLRGPVRDTLAFWPAGVAALVCALMAAMGHVRVAFVIASVLIAPPVAWFLGVGHQPVLALEAVQQLSQPLVGALVHLEMQRVDRQRLALSRAENHLREEILDQEGRSREVSRLMRRVNAEAGALLEAVLLQDRLDPAQRHDAALVEAGLRDWIRGGVLADDAVVRLARQARERGCTVELLDDGGYAPSAADPAFRDAVAQQLGTLERGSGCVVRRLPTGREGALSVVTTLPDGSQRRRLWDEEGKPL